MRSRSLNLMIALAILISLLGGMLTFTPAQAASIVVNSNADTIANDGACTLREAITNANNENTSGSTDCAAGAGADTITFAANYTITLVGSQLPAITTVITINGNGEANTIIQANAAANTATYRVLEVGAAGTLTLSSLTVRHGRCAGACTTNTNSGGGIYNAGILAVSNMTFSANNANVSGGGLLNFTNSSATLTNVTFSANSAGTGGGMYNRSVSPTLTNVTFSANNASVSGGGMFNFTNSNPTLTNVTFNANSATTSGGGMLNTGSSPTLTNVTFSANSATSGGGMFNNTSNPILTNVTFSANSATTNGGGMYNATSSPTLTNLTFSANSATNNGGGMYNIGGATVTVTKSTFSGNSASLGGGGIYNQGGTINIANSTFSGNSTNNEGGGLSKFQGTATVLNSTFSGNSSAFNGGNLASYTGTTTLKNTIIANRTGGTSECLSNAGTLTADNTNIDTDGSCDNAVQKTSAQLNLGSLQDNGGPTQTISLLTGSHAIDGGDATTCSSAPVSGKDQRGVTRPQGAGCDIGAFESGAITPVVTASNPSANAVLTSLSSITIIFNQDMLNDGSAKAANNTVNYILVEQGTNGNFDTLSCNSGVVSDDMQQTINTASYNGTGFLTTLTLANPLTAGTYRLFICGTTSIWSAAGLELNNGANDTTIDFTITGGTAAAAAANTLPLTGFAPSTITSLPQQPAQSAYTNLGDLWLEIPTLKVKSNIVGVSQSENDIWDVKWLGRDAGWLNGTAYPTWTGNSVITGHVYDASGLPGIFVGLKDLKKDDQIIIHMGSEKYIFQVQSSKLVRPDTTAFALEHLDDNSYLTLVTCASYDEQSHSYLFRRLVRAVLVEVQSE